MDVLPANRYLFIYLFYYLFYLVVDRLNVPEIRVNFRELQEKWPHVADLELNEVSVTPVTLLLASDVLELIVPLETRCGRKGSPVGVRT